MQFWLQFLTNRHLANLCRHHQTPAIPDLPALASTRFSPEVMLAMWRLSAAAVRRASLAVSLGHSVSVASNVPARRKVSRPEHLEQAAALHADGLTIGAIAELLELKRSTTRRLLVASGPVGPPSDETTDRRRYGAQLHARHLSRGATLPEAARETGVSVDQARLIIRESRALLTDAVPGEWR